MSIISFIIDFILHINVYLVDAVNALGPWSYILMFGIVFIETGAIILPFLPGDSLLFAAGAIAAGPEHPLNIWILLVGFFLSAFLGDLLNFTIGHLAGEKLLNTRLVSKVIKPHHVQETHRFYEKHGAAAIILARYMPIIRILAPFIAAVSRYQFKQFIGHSFIGALSWSLIGVGSGYLFGGIPFVQKHFEVILLAIIGVTLLPAIIAFISSRLKAKKKTTR